MIVGTTLDTTLNAGETEHWVVDTLDADGLSISLSADGSPYSVDILTANREDTPRDIEVTELTSVLTTPESVTDTATHRLATDAVERMAAVKVTNDSANAITVSGEIDAHEPNDDRSLQHFLGTTTTATLDGAPGVQTVRDLLPEGQVTGKDATTTGVKYSGDTQTKLDAGLVENARHVYLEAATASSNGDETVDVEIYDATAAAVIDSVSIGGGASRVRSPDLVDALTAGNEVYVRFNVTTASAGTAATFDANLARLLVE